MSSPYGSLPAPLTLTFAIYDDDAQKLFDPNQWCSVSDIGGVARILFQRAGLIRYKRGNVTILNRRGLQVRSCGCYGVSKLEFDRLLGDRATRKIRAGRK